MCEVFLKEFKTQLDMLLKTFAICLRRYKLHQNCLRAAFSLVRFCTLTSIRRCFRQGLSWNLRLEECESMSDLTSRHNQQLLSYFIMTVNTNLLIIIINNKVDFLYTYHFCYHEFCLSVQTSLSFIPAPFFPIIQQFFLEG